MVASVLSIVLFGSLIPLAAVSAASVSVMAASGGSTISADNNGMTGFGTYTVLTGPVLTEPGFGVLGNGTIVFNAPAGFQFNPLTGSVAVIGCGSLGATLTPGSSPTITITGAPSTGGGCTLTVSGLGVRPVNATFAAAGDITNSGTANVPSPGAYGHLTEVVGAPVLTFTSGPIANTTGGATLAPNPAFHDGDAEGNNRSGDGITLSIKAGTGTAGAMLSCATNPKGTGGSGNVTFTGCSVDRAGTGYVLRATIGTSSADSNAFNVSIGSPSMLVFETSPALTTPSILTPQPSVAVTDAGGNVISTDNSTVITLGISANSGTLSCTGGLSRTVTAGVASFAGCTQTSTGTYTLSAMSAPAVTGAVSSSFTVASGTASKLAFCWASTLVCPTAPPVGTTGGTAFSAQPTIRVEDPAGNTVASDSSTVVTLSIAGGTPTSGGPGTLTCTGGNSMTVSAGIATFSGCSIDRAGIAYQLVASSSPAQATATSGAFTVTAGPASKLAFTIQPTTTSIGTAFPSNVAVAIEDAGSNVISSGIVATIQLGIGSNPGGGTLTCLSGNAVATVGGVATFTGCSINAAGNGYTLTATAISTTPVTTLAPATSIAFNVSNQAANLTVTPSATVITWGNGVTLTVTLSPNGSGKQVQLQVSRDNATWSTVTTLTLDATGTASFAYRPSDNRYYRANFLGTPDLSAGISPSARVVVRQISLLRPTNGGKIRTISHGTTIVFTTTIRPSRSDLPQAHANFLVFQLVNGHWTQVVTQTVAVNSAGIATLTVTFSSRGQYYVRSQAIPTTFNANSGLSVPLERYSVV